MSFFKFSPESWLTGKIQLLSTEEKGIFIELAARIWQAGGSIEYTPLLHRVLRVEKGSLCNALDSFVELDIVQISDGIVRMKFITEQISDVKEYSTKQSEYGKLGGRPRGSGNKGYEKGSLYYPSENKGYEKGSLENKKGTPENKKGTKAYKDKDKDKDKDKERNIIQREKTPALVDATKIIREDLAEAFRRWLTVWSAHHGGGKDMPPYQQEANLKVLYDLPEGIRREAIERAIRGAWRAIHDIREPMPGARGGSIRNSASVLTTEQVYSKSERGSNQDEWN
jgi:uncharacterized protein YdaU (DUF1376 family)